MRLWERICEDLQDFGRGFLKMIIHETLGEDSLRIHETLGEDS